MIVVYVNQRMQVTAGIFALVAIAAMSYLSVRLGRLDLFATPAYTLYAIFDDITGLKTRDRVEIAGVSVGKVSAISLRDRHPFISMQLDDGVEVDDDATAAIKTNGIIGRKYVAITPGSGGKRLKNGDTIRNTKPAFVLEDAIRRLIK
jgi:phospholipid/cholesterol/gamma-HCH transport system substrate-binding protein